MSGVTRARLFGMSCVLPNPPFGSKEMLDNRRIVGCGNGRSLTVLNLLDASWKFWFCFWWTCS